MSGWNRWYLVTHPARVMVAIVVNPQKVSGANEAGAKALQQYLLTPAAQAQIRTFRVPGIDQELWWPAGRNNEDDFLPNG
jgi:ABC-type tungstate transport system permease subunit